MKSPYADSLLRIYPREWLQQECVTAQYTVFGPSPSLPGAFGEVIRFSRREYTFSFY